MKIEGKSVPVASTFDARCRRRVNSAASNSFFFLCRWKFIFSSAIMIAKYFIDGHKKDDEFSHFIVKMPE